MVAHAWQPLSPRWPRLRAGQALVWPLPASAFDGLRPQLDVDGRVLQRKGEFHATQLDTATTQALRQALAALPATRARRWRASVTGLDWRWRRLDAHWLVARRGGGKPDAWSIVEAIEQPAQQQLRERVAELLGRPLASPFPHVTLYTHGDRGGIGLPDPDTFAARCVRALALPRD